jgi:hypothetical protein
VVNGVLVHVNCGPAEATVTVRRGTKAPTTYRFRNGQCRRFAKYFAVNVGTLVLDRRARERRPYFGLLIGKFSPFPGHEGEESHFSEGPVVSKDGTYKGGLIAVYLSPNTAYSFSGGRQLTVTLRDHRQAGEFAGSKEADTQFNAPAMSISGSFTC